MFGSNLKRIRKLKKLTMDQAVEAINQQYGDIIRINKGNLSKWENDKAEPMLSTVRILADFYGLSVDDLVNGNFNDDMKKDILPIYNQLEKPRQEKVYNFAEYQLNEQKEIHVNIYGQTAAGQALEYDQSDIEEEIVSYVPKGTDGALVVRGDSMEPLLKNNELLFFKQTPHVENGDIAVVEIEGNSVTTKKVKYDFENQKIILESLNKKYEDMVFDNEDIRIIGKVLF